MWLEGSCHCGAVTFRVRSTTPCPYMRCYCSICRKTAGGGGYAINIMGEADTLSVQGEAALGVYRAHTSPGGAPSSLRRHFCTRCGSALWVADPHWPDGVWPFASAIDTPLPAPPAEVHIMEAYRPDWAIPAPRRPVEHFAEYPALSIADWHDEHGVTVAGE
jgi:hypothetical protein